MSEWNWDPGGNNKPDKIPLNDSEYFTNKNWAAEEERKRLLDLGYGNQQEELEKFKRENQSDSDEEKTDDGGCYIATATLGYGASDELDVLRAFRDEVVGKTRFGRKLIAFYRRTAPEVAGYIKGNPALKTSFRLPFIQPSLWLMKLRPNSFRNAIVYFVFLLGLSWATLLRTYIRIEASFRR